MAGAVPAQRATRLARHALTESGFVIGNSSYQSGNEFQARHLGQIQVGSETWASHASQA